MKHNINKTPQIFAQIYNDQIVQQNNNNNVDHGTTNDDYKPFDHKYWMEYLDFDATTVRMCYQGNADYLTDLDIHPEDIHHISTPMHAAKNDTSYPD